MKRLTFLLLILSLTLVLTACSPNRSKTPFSPTLIDPLLQSDAFSEPLEPLEEDLAWMLYGLEDSGLSRDDLTALHAYRSSGATCEELAILLFTNETAAQTVANALDLYITGQIQSNKDYRPAEIPKLEQTFLEQRGTTVLLMVADNYKVAYEILAP